MVRSAQKNSGPTLAEAAKQAATARRRVAVPARKVAVIPLADLRLLRRLEREAEDREDNAAMSAALAESEERIPYNQVRRELGLDRE